MLEQPDIADDRIIAGLRAAYGLRARELKFLPLGADPNSAVYRMLADDGTAYFVKLRSGAFDDISVALPKWLAEQGLGHIIAPLATATGTLTARLEPFAVVVYPFVTGRDGYAVRLSERQWAEFGAFLRRLHSAAVPPEITLRIQRETYTTEWRERVNRILEAVAQHAFAEDAAVQLVRGQQHAIRDLVARADRLARALLADPPPLTVCHSDLHAGNLLLDDTGGLFIVDWDAPILAPKERDLMYVGGGQGFVGYTADQETALFYRGYGPTAVDPRALAYYRYERIIQDIALYCEDLLLSADGGADRAQALLYLRANFEPNGTIAVAYRADTTQLAM